MTSHRRRYDVILAPNACWDGWISNTCDLILQILSNTIKGRTFEQKVFIVFDCTTGTVWVSYYICRKKMLPQCTTIRSQSNMINLAISIIWKVVRRFSGNLYIYKKLLNDSIQDSKDIGSLLAWGRAVHSLTTEGKKNYTITVNSFVL